jgi:hypothetical protein
MFQVMRILSAALLLAVSLAPVRAQSPAGGLVGIIRDASGAGVPDAAVGVRNVETNITRQGRTDHQGGFAIPNLPPGNYDVTVEKAGFQKLRESGLELQVNQTARLELQLTVGALSEAIEVKARAPQINTENAARGDVVSADELQEMPLDGRDFQDLAFLVPGVARNAEGDNAGPFAVNGARSDNTNFYLDGFNNRDPRFGGAQASPNLDAMQEFKMETSGYSAEFGRLAGGVMSVVLKGGTNRMHGTLFEFVRNDKFDARNFFAADKNKLRRNQFGGTLNGPVWLPRLYDGRNRTFFLFSWESYRSVAGNNKLSRVPTELERQGDFSQTVDVSGKLVTIKDPLAANAVFPANRVPSERFNPIASNILPYFPLPNRPGQANNYLSSAVSTGPWNSYMSKIDQTISARDSFSFRYQRRDSGGINPFVLSPLGTFGAESSGIQHLLGFNATHLFSPTLIQEFRFSLSRNTSHGQNVDAGENLTLKLGISGTTTDPHFIGFPIINVRDLATLGDKSDRPSDVAVNLYQWSDTITWVKNRHLIKFGGEILRSQTFQPYGNNTRGTVNFLGNWTGQPFADFLIGLPDSASRQSVVPLNYLFSTDCSAFVQDDFKISSRLTLNLGLRWELPGSQYDKYGRYSGFVPSLGKLIVADDRGTPNLTALVDSVKLTGIVGLARDYGIPQSLVFKRYHDLAPRFGFAWRPLGGNRSVVRGGFGVFDSKSAQNPMTQSMSNVFPFGITQTVNRTATNPNALSFANPFANASGAAVNVGGVDMYAPRQYLLSWNLTMEREVRGLGAVEISYAGSKGTHLSYTSDINRPLYTLDMRQPNGSFPRPYPQISNAINYFQFGANSIYNSGTLTLRRRFSNGLFYRVNYVYSKSIDNSSTFSGTGNGGPKQIQDPRNLAAERARSNFDSGHSFTVSFSYQAPWRRAQLKWLMGGWQLAGTGRAYTGAPFTPVTSNFNLALGTAIRPDRLATGTVAKPTPDRWFDVAAFPVVPNGSYRFGSSGRNILDGPGMIALNFSLFKNYKIRERDQLQFRWELFNVSNHPNFNLPNASVNALNGATITTAQAPRTMQFGIRYQF